MSIIFKKFQRDLYSELPKIAVSIIIISMGIGGFITFFQVSDNIKETVDSQYEEMNLGDSWVNLQPIPTVNHGKTSSFVWSREIVF